jgi:hypothetical protein
MSNPERKKERTDAKANEREIYVAGLSKFTAQEDLQKLFSTVRTFVDAFVHSQIFNYFSMVP